MAFKNIKDTNPETAFWIATATLVVTQGIKVRELRKNNKQYIVDAIKSRNQSMNKEPHNSKKYENKEREEDAETRKDIFIKNAI